MINYGQVRAQKIQKQTPKPPHTSLPKLPNPKKQFPFQKFPQRTSTDIILQQSQPQPAHSALERRRSNISFNSKNILRFPKSEGCWNRNMSYNIGDGDGKVREGKAGRGAVFQGRFGILRPLEGLGEDRPDDCQSEHKVVMRISTQGTLPPSLSSLLVMPPTPTLPQSQNTTTSPRVPKISPFNQSNKSQEQPLLSHTKTQQKICTSTQKHNAEVQVDIDLSAVDSNQQIDGGEHRQHDIPSIIEFHVKANSYANVRDKVINARRKKQQVSRSRVSKTEPHITQQQENDEEPEPNKNQPFQPRQLPQPPQPSSPSSIMQPSLTQIPQFPSSSSSSKKQQNPRSLISSCARSTSTGTAKNYPILQVPQKQQYAQYLEMYQAMDQMFDLKALMSRDKFGVVELQEEVGGVYFGELGQAGKHGHGQGILVTEGSVFQGLFQNGEKVKGCQKTKDGVYRGYFQNGMREGYGVFQWNNGEKFEGNWKHGVKSGFGIWRSPQGYSYEGEWMNNKQHGKGVFRHRNSIYRGQFQNFLKHGSGVELFMNGNQYIGEYRFGKPEGHGKYSWHNGAQYQGNFRNGLIHGQGRLLQSNGDIYTGNFSANGKEGQGRQDYKSGGYFEGVFKNGCEFKGTINKEDGTCQHIDIDHL